MKIIGHRGVRGIETENTKSSLKEAVRLGVDAVEMDVRKTLDGELVICHNRNLKEIYGLDKNIDEINFSEARALTAKNGEKIPTLQEILELRLGKPIFVDVKNRGSARLIYEQMKAANQEWSVNTFLPEEAKEFKKLDPDIWVSFASFKHPRVVSYAKKLHANSITIPVYLLNPLIYWLAKKAGLKVMVYQNYVPWLLTTPAIVRALNRFYPDLIFITDRPDKIASLFKR